MSSFRNATLIALSVILCQGCDLGLQTSYDFDENDHPQPQEAFATNMYDWMSEREEFSLMVSAIQRADMVDEFRGGDSNRTVLILRNEAVERFLSDYKHASIDDVPISRLQTLLNYHIVTTKFGQKDLNSQEDYVFQTQVAGDDGLINIWKWRRYWEIRVNRRGPNLPSSAKGDTVYLHNYEFENGMAHQMRRYVQRVPF